MSTKVYKTKFDQPHILNAGVNYSKNQFKFFLGWQFMSGLSAVFPSSRRMEEGGNPPPGGGPPSGGGPGPGNSPPRLPDGTSLTPYAGDRYPFMHQLDASVSYSFPKKVKNSWSGSIGLPLLNLGYNQKNLIDQVERMGGLGVVTYVDRYGIAFAPNLMLVIEW